MRVPTDPTRRTDAAGRAMVRRFIACINRGDVNGLAGLMTDDHLFIDGMGNRVRIRRAMARGWAGYFAMVPDYAIEVEDVFVRGRTIAVLGFAGGSYVSPSTRRSAGTWRVPAAWRAVVRRGRVAEWQVYADNEPIRQLMRRADRRRRSRRTR